MWNYSIKFCGFKKMHTTMCIFTLNMHVMWFEIGHSLKMHIVAFAACSSFFKCCLILFLLLDVIIGSVFTLWRTMSPKQWLTSACYTKFYKKNISFYVKLAKTSLIYQELNRVHYRNKFNFIIIAKCRYY